MKVFYGDASRNDLLNAAGAKDARILIVAVDEPEKTIEIVETARKHFPHLNIIARSKYWNTYLELLEMDLLGVYREFSDVALRMAADTLGHLGYRKNQVQRSLNKFRKHDEAYLKDLAASRHEQKSFIQQSRKIIQDLELMMLEDMENEAKDKDLGWNTETIIEEFAPLMRQFKEGKK